MEQSTKPDSAAERTRRAALEAAEARGLELFELIESRGLIAAGRGEREVEQDIFRLAASELGVQQHWHKRIVRAGPNTLTTYHANPPLRTIMPDDLVYLDLGPVFETWEADIGRTYVLGTDPVRHALVRDLERAFGLVQAHYRAQPDITGAELFAFAERCAAELGWQFGGEIAGHIIAEFPHAHLPGDKELTRISPNNPTRLSDPDANGRERHWILEIHLVDRARELGGFYERLI